MFRKILIANRGEIACRIARTARRLGVQTVAVYSDADARSSHVAECDEAYRIGPPPSRESYLDGDAIIAVAQRAGVEAIHPGYGFLSENAAFAAACAAAKLVFIGPSPDAIAAMGSKSAAKRIMGAAGVPLVPGYHGEDQGEGFLAEQAASIGFPVLIKAVFGGGGRGMRIAATSDEFSAALTSAKREAQSSFGNDAVLIERYLERPRHIEMQVFGDAHGNVVHLFERDCSVQRRHQKVLEEAPAPGMTPERRRAMAEASVAAARAIAYVGAGTVEFIAEQDGTFYFMEMNTRLQVEHPVTEMITGLDLVEWQLCVASGERLPLRQEEIALDGHAIEARIYAEDAENEFLPSTGTLAHLRLPRLDADVRVDSGVREGDTITPYYDPMIAKLIVHGSDREAARSKLVTAMGEYEIAGVTTNVAFLRAIATHDAFARAELDTGLIARHWRELLPSHRAMPYRVLLAAALAEAVRLAERANELARASPDPYTPWAAVDAWWLNSERHALSLVFDYGAVRYEIALRKHGAAWRVQLPQALHTGAIEASVVATGSRLRIVSNAQAFEASVVAIGDERYVFCGGEERRLTRVDPLAHHGEEEAQGGHLTAPMSGVVVAVLANPGDDVRKGSPLMVLEAMKMEHTIRAPADGRLRAVNFAVGERVNEGADLLDIQLANAT